MYGYSVGNKGLKELFPCVEYLVGLIHISELLVIMAGKQIRAVGTDELQPNGAVSHEHVLLLAV